MKTVTLEVDDLLSPLAGRGLEKRLSHTAGIAHADVNDASGGVSVTYDPAILDLAAIRALVKECGYHCSGEIVPKHVCYPNGAADTLASTPGRTRSSLAKPVRKQIADGHAAKRDQMVQEMGHGSGMDMGAMVLDMRNRFWICLGFTLALLAFSPMGLKIPSLAPPFGLDLNVVLFVLASGAILYPSWTFVVSAYRALRTGVLNMAVLVVLSVYTGYLLSVGATFFFKGSSFYEAAAVLLVFILLGHWLEMRARAGASQAMSALLNLAPPMATFYATVKSCKSRPPRWASRRSLSSVPGRRLQ